MSRRRIVLCWLLAALVCAVLNPGGFGTIDTPRRLQVARWFRLGEPPARAFDTEFGITGRHGVKHAWYGPGQSLMLIPLDVVADLTVRPLARRAGLPEERQRQAAETLIAWMMQTIVTALTLLAGDDLLRRLNFTDAQAMAGALALLFGTLYLQFVQSAQENNLLLLLALACLSAILRGWPVAAGCAAGFAILVRLPSILEAAAICAFGLWMARARWQFLLRYAAPVTAAIAIDRIYHWYRFGEWTSTYMSILAKQFPNPNAGPGFPFSTPFLLGFARTWFHPDKSILLYDPLLAVALIALAWRWRTLATTLRRAAVCLICLLIAYVSFYSKYYDLGGDVSWGHRFVTLPVQLLCLFAVPLLMASSVPRWVLHGVIAIAVILQCCSTMLAPNLEVAQRQHGFDRGVLANRIANLKAVATGDTSTPRFAGIPPEWRSVYYLPFQLRFRFPALAPYAIAAWVLMLAAIPVLAWKLRQSEEP